MSIRDDLIRDEGDVPYAYKDSRGFWTIGVGFLVDKDQGGRLPEAVRDYWLDYLIADHKKALDAHLAWWRGRSQSVQDSLVNMLHQMGMGGLLQFQKMLAALHAGDFETAKTEARNSQWHKQTPERAERVIAGFVP